MTQKQIPIMILSPTGDTDGERLFIKSNVIPNVQAAIGNDNGSLVVIDPYLNPVSDPDQILENCFSLIDRYRPYIIGILSEQYGCIFPKISDNTCERHPWLQSYLDRSVTELEIRYSAFIDPIPCHSAFFYMKSQKSRSDIIQTGGKLHSAQPESSIKKLKNLKKLIRSSNYLVYEGSSTHLNTQESGTARDRSDDHSWAKCLEEWLIVEFQTALTTNKNPTTGSAIVY